MLGIILSSMYSISFNLHSVTLESIILSMWQTQKLRCRDAEEFTLSKQEVNGLQNESRQSCNSIEEKGLW